MTSAATPTADRFGNPLDAIVRYARGTILKSTDEEVERMLRARAGSRRPSSRISLNLKW